MWWLKRSSFPHLCARYLMLLCTVGFVLLPTSYVWANPAGEAVVGGAASFQRDGNKLTVNQATDRLAVNWQSFNIGAGETTHFNMPSSTSAALNRVIGGNPSSIYGSLSANGILYLINPSGILVGPGGTVNAASFMASTLDVSTEQFMNAKSGVGMNFYGSSGESIINQGNITAEKGDVFLIAQKVENRGTINAANGTAGMVGSGQNTDVMVHEVGGKGFAIRVAQLQGEAATGSNRDLPDGEELLNEGSINAAQAELNASGNVYALAIRNSGTIRAKAVVANADGTVRLDGGLGDVMNTGTMIAKNVGNDATAAGGKIDVAGQNITASVESIITAAGGEQGGNGGSVKIDSQDTTILQGKVDVTAASEGAKGGKVQLLGERVGMFEGAKVDASGGAGGGTVLVGGDYLGGQTPSADLKDMAKQEAEPVKNAKAVVMADTAEIKADATVNGDGGKVVLWSGGYTGFYGKIFSRGGAKGGYGGFVETSSHQNLQAFGTADASAPKGKAGQWLLDPYDIVIGTTDSGITGNPSFTANGNADPAIVSAATINTALNGGTSVTVTTVSGGGTNATGTGAITVSSSISKTTGAAASFTLNSISTIKGGGNITSSSGALSVFMNSDADNTYSGNITTLNGAVQVVSSGGSVKLTGGIINAGTGTISLSTTGSGDIVLDSDLTSSSSVTLNSISGEITIGANIDVSSATTLVGPGQVSLNASTGISRGSGGVITLPAFQTANFAALSFNTGGDVSIVVATGAELAVGDPGPAISGVSTSGKVTLRNVGLALSTLDLHGIQTTAGFDLSGGLGTTILTGQIFDTGGSDSYIRSGEVTAGIIVPNSTTRLFPKVVSPGSITFAGVVTLNAYDATNLRETGLTVIQGDGINFFQAINDGSIAVDPNFLLPLSPGVPPGVKVIQPTQNEQLLLLNAGVTAFQPEAFVGTARAITSNQATIKYLSLGPLLSFRQENGSIDFQQPATAIQPSAPTLGNVDRPTIYSLGSVTFDSANIRIFENTYITSAADVYFGGTVDANFLDTAGVFNVNTINAGGQVIFDGVVGGIVPLGGLVVSTSGGDDYQININAGAVTFAGKNPVKSGALGQIDLDSSGSIVLAGNINSTGGANTIGGDFTFTTAENALQNIQLGANLVTRGGTITFNSPLFVAAASSIDNTLADKTGAITFGSDSTDSVFLESSLALASGGDVTFKGDLNGSGIATITVANGQNLTLEGGIGNTTPLGGFTVSAGSGDVYLSNNISTRGGVVSFGMRVRLADDVSIDTTLLNSATGSTIEFLQGMIGKETQAGSFESGIRYLITSLEGTDFGAIGAPTKTVGNFSFGLEYIITNLGTTTQPQWNTIAKTSDVTYAVGDAFTAYESGENKGNGSTFLTNFIATGAGTGGGKADQLRDVIVNGGILGRVGFGASAQDTSFSAKINSLTVLNAGTFSVTSALIGFGANSDGYALDVLPELAAAVAGGNNILQSNGIGNIILRSGINTSFLTAEAGDVTIYSYGEGNVEIAGSVAMDGGSNLLNTIGFDGGTLKVVTQTSFVMPNSISSTGGTGSFIDGKAGNVFIDNSLSSTADISFSMGVLDVIEDSQYTLLAGNNFYLAQYDAGADAITGGVVLQLNRTAQGANFALASRGSVTIGFGGNNPDGYFYAPGGSAILSYGGEINISRLSLGAAPVYVKEDGDFQKGGVNIYGQLFTTVNELAAGAININGAIINERGDLVDGLDGVVTIQSANTRGGEAATDTVVGLSGGSVNVSGTTVEIISQINTSGGDSLDGGTDSLGIGGSAGSITIKGTTIKLVRSLTAKGGRGISQLAGFGGGGGAVTLDGIITLDSGNSSLSSITIDSSGGLGLGTGNSGRGGNIIVLGPLSGTPTTSNTLQLTHGSGTVTLAAVTLAELITADPAGVAGDSTGAVTINGALSLTTLTTQGFGYSLSILGGGTIENRVTFLNTGTTTIGAAGVTTTFTDGFDALNGATKPSTLNLGGTINTVTATTGSMLADTTVLVADTTLNSAGNIMQFGSLDGLFGLTLAAGVATGATTFSGAIGDTTQVGQITVATGVTGLVNFASTVKATGIQSVATSQLTFNNDVTLSSFGGATTDLGGTVILNNAAYADDLTAVLSFLGAGAKTFSGATTFTGGPIELGGLGDYTVSGTMNGAQNLTLSGLGTKTFTVIVGGTTALGTGTGAAISMSGGNVLFGRLTTASGIVSSAKVTLAGVTTLAAGDTASSLTGDVDLLGATLTSAGTVGLGDSAADSVKLDGTVVVDGIGAVNIGGTVTDNAGFTSFTQAGTAGKIRFDEDVTLDVVAGSMTLNGNVGLSEMSFSAVGTVTLGDALTDSITLANAAVTLTGAGTFAVNGVVVGGDQDLTLSGTGGKTFNGGLSGLGTLALTAGTGTFGSTVLGVAFNQSGGVAVLNGDGTFTGGSTLGGTSTTLNGITFSSGTTAVTGVLTSTGATTITGGLITLNTASAVTSSSGVLTMGSAVSLGQGTTLSGTGAYKLSGPVNGANGLTLSGAGAKTFSGLVGTGTALTTVTQNDASGLVTFNENVTMSGAGAFNSNLGLDGLTMTSTGSTLTFGNAGTDTVVISGATTIQTAGQNITLNSATTLNAALTMSDFGAVGGTTTLSGTVTGKSSNLTITTDNVVVENTIQTGSGVVSLVRKDGGDLEVGGTSGFLDAAEISEISTSGGLTVATGGDITINELVLGDTDQITGAFRMVTSGGDINVAESVQLNVFSGSAIAGALTATGSTLTDRLATQDFRNLILGVGGLEYDAVNGMTLSGVQVSGDIVVTSVDSMTINGSLTSDSGLIDLGAGGNIQVSSQITASTEVTIESDGYFINSFNGNPFQSASTRVVTSDLFGATWPSNGAVPGLQVVYGVNSIGQLSANQIGVSTTLLAGNAAPFILEFTTGTGQPYILAQQAAIPPVMLPVGLTGGSGFTKAVSYSPDELEMMTPEERSAYENQQRQSAARVILQRENGEGEEIGAPMEGRTPQAATPAALAPVAPTARVLLEGKPLAGAKSDQERGDATKIIKLRPTRAVALRSGYHGTNVMEAERMAAEVNVGAAPVVQNR